MNLLGLLNVRVGVLLVSFALTALVASAAHAQEQPPPAPGGETVIVIVPPAPMDYPPVQVVGMPGVYGTAYAEQSPNLRVGMLQQELLAVQAQYAQYPIGGAITLLAIGGATTVFAGAFFLIYSLADTISSSDGAEHGMLISGLFALGGVAMLVGGISMLVSRVSERRPYGLRIREIKRELAAYGVRASLDVMPVSSGALLTGTLSF